MNNPNNMMAVMWYLVDFIPELRHRDYQTRAKIGKECQELSDCHPLHMTGADQFFKVESFNPNRNLTGSQVIALMVAVLWVTVGEDPKMCSSLYETWPIHDAMTLIDLNEQRQKVQTVM